MTPYTVPSVLRSDDGRTHGTVTVITGDGFPVCMVCTYPFGMRGKGQNPKFNQWSYCRVQIVIEPAVIASMGPRIALPPSLSGRRLC